MPPRIEVRRLAPADAPAYRALRLEGFAAHPREFRYSPADEEAVTMGETGRRLADSFVVGVFADGALGGIGGWTRFAGEKLRHKGLLWGMYVQPALRGTGAADRIVEAIIDDARGQVERLLLTVATPNMRARRLYERWGFAAYGTEPRAVRDGETYIDEVLMALHLG